MLDDLVDKSGNLKEPGDDKSTGSNPLHSPTIQEKRREFQRAQMGQTIEQMRHHIEDDQKEEVFSERKRQALKEALRANLKNVKGKGKGKSADTGATARSKGPETAVSSDGGEEPVVVGDGGDEGSGEEPVAVVPDTSDDTPVDDTTTPETPPADESEEGLFVLGGSSFPDESGAATEAGETSSLASAIGESLLTAFAMGSVDISSGMPIELRDGLSVQISGLPITDPQLLASRDLPAIRLDLLQAPGTTSAIPGISTKIARVEEWMNKELAFIVKDLASKHPGKAPKEVAIAVGLPPSAEVNDWINLAVYFLFWEYKRDKEKLFDSDKLEDAILAGIRHFYESYERAKDAPESIVVVEKTILCTFKMPAALLGRPLTFKEIERRRTHKRHPCIALQQRNPKTPLEAPLRKVEDSLNMKIDARAREYAAQYGGQRPGAVFPQFQNCNWEEVATFAILRGKDPSA